MDPERLGIPRSMIILGKHSGRHAIKHRVSQFGIQLNDEQMESLYKQFKDMADRQKVVHDHQLLALVGHAVNEVLEPYMLVSAQLVTGSTGHRMASCTIRDNHSGKETMYTGSGEGPIGAIAAGIKQALPFEAEFADLELYSLSAGEGASGEAIVTVRVGANRYRGIAVDRDVTMAAAFAFMAACNQAAREGMRSAGGQMESAYRGDAQITIP